MKGRRLYYNLILLLFLLPNPFINGIFSQEKVLLLTNVDKSKQAEGYLLTEGLSTIISIEPLLTTYWGQSCYYNDLCPVDSNGNCYHARAGCGATAMTQILKYYNYPETGVGTKSFYHPVYGNLSANFESTNYDWQNMPVSLSGSSPPEEIYAVAQLMYHFGVAIEMDYGPGASSSGSTSIRDAIFDFFNYSSNAQLIRKSFFSDSAWKVILINELEASRPMFYCISSGSGGHFIVCDGYYLDAQDSIYFHFNWGYANGYYKLLSELPPVQEAIIGIEPNTENAYTNNNFFARHCRFDDGSGINTYKDSLYSRYLINPAEANSIALFFSDFKTESGFDYLRIYDGDTTGAGLLGEYSGNNLPPHLVSSGGEMLLEFITNDSIESDGWEINYSGEYPDVTSGLHIITDSTGTLDDGSGTGYYGNHIDAFWLIQPTEASSVTISFNTFNTEFSCDYLRVYDGDNTSPENLLGAFSGTSLPPDLTANSGKMLFHFNTDFSTTRPGWEVSFISDFEKIFLDLKVFLEGPFNGVDMNTDLSAETSVKAGLTGNPELVEGLPLSQPFNIHPWNYFGSEDVMFIPNTDIVDWILIELRETAYGADSATSKTIIAQRAVFLLNDGLIVGLDGDTCGNTACCVATQSITNNLFIVIRHRNHLDIMSAVPLTESGGRYSYDFSTGLNKVYGDSNGYKELTTGLWGIIAGDGDGNGLIGLPDKTNTWELQAGETGYYSGDYNLDSQVDNKDKDDYWLPNVGKGMQIPE